MIVTIEGLAIPDEIQNLKISYGTQDFEILGSSSTKISKKFQEFHDAFTIHINQVTQPYYLGGYDFLNWGVAFN